VAVCLNEVHMSILILSFLRITKGRINGYLCGSIFCLTDFPFLSYIHLALPAGTEVETARILIRADALSASGRLSKSLNRAIHVYEIGAKTIKKSNRN
jgi:hypothetical protein